MRPSTKNPSRVRSSTFSQSGRCLRRGLPPDRLAAEPLPPEPAGRLLPAGVRAGLLPPLALLLSVTGRA